MADGLYGFKNVDEYGSALTTDQLEYSVATWLQWGLLGVGAFNTAQKGGATAHGSKDPSQLRPVVDPRYTNGTVWQALRTEWVWETGVPYSSQPIRPSGVYINNTFVPASSTGAYAHKVSYPEGRVYFSSVVPATSVINCPHSYRHVQVRRADEPWFQALALNSFRADDPQWTQTAGSGGAWDILAQNRIQLPAMVVEPVPQVNLKGYEIGGAGRVHGQPVLVHVFAETPWERNRLHDILVEQFDKRIVGVNANSVPRPLNYDGTVASPCLTYPDQAQQYRWRTIRVAGVESAENDSLGERVHWCTVRLNLEVDSP